MKIPDFSPIKFCGFLNDITTAVAKEIDSWQFYGCSETSQSLDWSLNRNYAV